jgi:nitrogen-specific signal transduction histidine kinase
VSGSARPSKIPDAAQPTIDRRRIQHEANNLLSIVLGNAELLSHALESDSHLAKVQAIIQAANQLAKLIRE